MALLPQEIVYEGFHFPAFLDTPSAVGKILVQQPGKMRASQLSGAGMGEGVTQSDWLLMVLISCKGVGLLHSHAKWKSAAKLTKCASSSISTVLNVSFIIKQSSVFSHTFPSVPVTTQLPWRRVLVLVLIKGRRLCSCSRWGRQQWRRGLTSSDGEGKKTAIFRINTSVLHINQWIVWSSDSS